MPLDGSAPVCLTPMMKPGESSPILFPVVERKLLWETQGGDTVPFNSHKAIVRPVNQPGGKVGSHVINVVTNTYKLVENRALFNCIEETMLRCIDEKHLIGVKLKDSVAHNGRTCYREYVFPNLRCDIGARSDIGFRIVISNGYGGSSIKLLAGAIEFFCTNGMVSGQYETTYARHSSGLTLERFDRQIRSALETFVTDAKKWRKWTQQPVKFAAAIEFFKSIAGNETFERKLANQYAAELDERGENLWAVYSTLTYYASHNSGDFQTRNTESDGTAATMIKRETDVAKWIKTPEFKQLELV